MAASALTFETGHEEMIHDAQLDYYSKRLATASSDRTIKIFDVAGGNHQLIGEIKGHSGPVWQVAWAHPKFGNLLASCSYDHKVAVWKEENNNVWVSVFSDTSHMASVNAVSWAPHSFGLILAVASADGCVSIHTCKGDNNWEREAFEAHPGGVNAISWAPDLSPGSLLDGQGVKPPRRFVTGGCDNRVKIWRFSDMDGKWVEEKAFSDMYTKKGHTDWVRDVAWAQSLGMPSSTIASCSEDRKVIIWSEDSNGHWKEFRLNFEHNVWRVSWSVMGNILAVSQGNNKVSLWKESLENTWKTLSTIDESDSDNKQIQS